MDLDDLYRILRGAHVQLQGVVDTIRDPLLVLNPDLTVVSANPAFYRTFETNRDETVGVLFYELGSGQWNIDELRHLLEDVIPKSAAVFDYEVIGSFPAIGHRTMLVSAQRIEHFEKGRRILLLSIADATARRQKERDKDILIGEFHHRMKNLLSVTHALARQTAVAGRTAEEYRDAFLGRFEALTTSLEVSVAHESTRLPELTGAVLEPFLGAGNAVELADQPEVALLPGQAMALGMILHELATNAMEHGALSVPDGRIRIDWNVEDEDGQVRLRWKESNGPRVAAPDEGGFGTRLIRFAAEHDLGGQAELHYEPAGLVATLTFPR